MDRIVRIRSREIKSLRQTKLMEPQLGRATTKKTTPLSPPSQGGDKGEVSNNPLPPSPSQGGDKGGEISYTKN